MFKYCVISSKQGRGGGLLKKATPGSIVVLLALSFFVFGAKIHAMESGSYNLNLDSAQDLLDVSKTVNEVVGEVIKDLTPTDLFNTGTNLPFNLPLNPLNHVKGFSISGLDTDSTDLDLTKFFSPAGFSSNDLLGILKGAAILSIQIFIVVVQVVSGIIKGLLGALNS
ncbi:MAG: hypothetical protein HYT66_01020 [Candidatus Yanofskybacteria bacterium]|nr:hypothetical protein [Candidatus Yanofskybacteria bacterium]